MKAFKFFVIGLGILVDILLATTLGIEIWKWFTRKDKEHPADDDSSEENEKKEDGE